MPKREWAKRNKAGAVALLGAGATIAEVVHRLEIAYTHPEARKYYARLSRLDKLSEAWSKLDDFASGRSDSSGFVWPDPYEHGGKSFMPEVFDTPDREQIDARIDAANALRRRRQRLLADRFAAEDAAKRMQGAAC